MTKLWRGIKDAVFVREIRGAGGSSRRCCHQRGLVVGGGLLDGVQENFEHFADGCFFRLMMRALSLPR